MNMKIFKSREDIAKAREALQRGDKESAWKLGRHAALALNPQSTRAHRRGVGIGSGEAGSGSFWAESMDHKSAR